MKNRNVEEQNVAIRPAHKFNGDGLRHNLGFRALEIFFEPDFYPPSKRSVIALA
jgi:hypothetical protein